MELNIELTRGTYQRLQEMAAAKNMTVEAYLSRELEAGRLGQDQVFKAYVISELEGLVSKIKGLEPEQERKKPGLKIYSYQQLKDRIPEEVNRLKALYEEKGWFHQEDFYLLMEGNRLLGYLGMSPHEEALPYGRYHFVYQLYLEASSINGAILQQLREQLQGLLKNRGIASVDTTSLSTNLKEAHLEQLGFLPFDSFLHIRLKAQQWRGEEGLSLKELSSLHWGQLKELLPVGRAYPLDYYIHQWKTAGNQEEIAVEGIEDALTVIRKQANAGKGRVLTQLFCLTDSQKLFDQELIIPLLRNLIKNRLEKGEEILTLMVPEGIEAALEGVEWEIQRRIQWYRKMIY